MESTALNRKIESYLEERISGGVHKGAFAIYGNAKNPKSKKVASAGYARPGKRYSKNTHIRLASQSKFIGGLSVAKCIELGIVKLSDPVGLYLKEFNNKQFQYYNTDGTIADDTVDSNIITLGHLVSMTSGLNYYFISWGNMYPGFKELIGDSKPLSESNNTRNAAIIKMAHKTGQFADWQFDPDIYKHMKSGKLFPSFKKYVKILTTIPLAFMPGTNSMREAVYGLDMDVLGACLNVAVQKAGYKSIFKFFKKYYLKPMEINDMYIIGDSDRPADADELLATTAFRRPKNNLQPDGTIFAPDPSPEYLAHKAGQLVWADEYEDGFRYNETLFRLSGPKYFEKDPYQGYFGAGWISSLSSFCRFFELMVNNGLYRGKRIVNAEPLKMILMPILPEYVSFALGRFNDPNIAKSTSELANPKYEAMFLYGYNEHWSIGNGMGNTAFVDSLYDHKTNKNCIRWGSYYGTNYICDLQTGNYVMTGYQEDANSLKIDDSSSWLYDIFNMINEPSVVDC